ncbi:MAG: ubiquinol-cytochrome c reductase iron-sulfur subunit [Acidiferrobacterales bacterium]
MASAPADMKRRRLLLAATTVMGAIGGGFAAAPFMLSMTPSERARAMGSPVEVDFSKLEEGQMLTVEWRGKPVWILQRTAAMLAQLERNTSLLADPNSDVESQQPPYAKNAYRSIRPGILVLIGICTHLGCVPLSRLVAGSASGLGDNWPGGYFCPCHGSKFDLAGRVFKNVPAPTNLVVPPYRFMSDTRLLVGESAPAV